MAPMAQRPPRNRGRRQRNSPAPALAQGEVVLSRSERLTNTSTDVKDYWLHPANFPWLKNLAQAFELYRWVRCNIEYRPLVGATKDGSAAVGVDWSAQSMTLEQGRYLRAGKSTRDDVLACTPNFDTPVWQRVPRLVLPADKLRQRLWYDLKNTSYDTAPGSVAVVSSSNDSGEIWVHYTVVMAGTRSV